MNNELGTCAALMLDSDLVWFGLLLVILLAAAVGAVFGWNSASN